MTPPEHSKHAQHGSEPHHSHHPNHSEHGGHMEHAFTDPERYADRWNDPARDVWQNPKGLIAAMKLSPGMTVADLGTGTGYLIPHLAAAIQDQGRVLAVDVERAMVDYTLSAARNKNLKSVEGVLAAYDDPKLPANQVDRIITLNTWHHISDRGNYAAQLREALKAGGSVWVVDFKTDAAVQEGPPPEHRLAPELVIQELQSGGLEASLHPIQLERQYVVVGYKR